LNRQARRLGVDGKVGPRPSLAEPAQQFAGLRYRVDQVQLDVAEVPAPVGHRASSETTTCSPHSSWSHLYVAPEWWPRGVGPTGYTSRSASPELAISLAHSQQGCLVTYIAPPCQLERSPVRRAFAS